jgi:hypothetical protein
VPIKIAVLLMQRNENKILPIWLKYYAAIFGSENLYVFDNNSDNQETLEIISAAKLKGVNCFVTLERNDFEKKGDILLEKAKELLLKDYDFAYFADADEFIVINSNGIPSINKEDIQSVFSSLSKSKNSIYRINHGWMNIPLSSLVYNDFFGTKKVILRKDFNPKLILDIGFHLYDWGQRKDLENFGPIEMTNLGILHFHNKNYEEYLAFAKQKLKYRVADFEVETLKAYKGSGIHLIENILNGHDAFYKQFDSRKEDAIDIKKIFTDLKIEIPHLIK